MREIKFRGKRKDNEEWVAGYFLETPYASYIATLTPAMTNEYEVRSDTIGQLTGSKDMEGKGIYEGDGGINLKLGSYYVKYGKYYDISGGSHIGYHVYFTNELIRRRYREDLSFWINNDGLTFDKNIHDNPELLEVQE